MASAQTNTNEQYLGSPPETNSTYIVFIMLKGLRWLQSSIAPRLRASSQWSRWHESPTSVPALASMPRFMHNRHAHWSSKIRAASQLPEGLHADEMYEEVEIELPSHCGGCGVRLQDEDPEGPG